MMSTNTDPDSASRAHKKSFAQILAGELQTGDVEIRKAVTYCNQPVIIFTEDEEKIMAEQFKYALVGKFSKGLPVFKSIHPALVKLGLKGAFSVGALKPGYIVINPSLEEDFSRLWVRQEWNIAGKSMRLFKWTTGFTYSAESAVAPVWVNLPDLPLHLFAKGALYSIASMLGNPIQIDEATSNRSRPSVARICIEMDLTMPSVPSVNIKSGRNTYVQKVFYEDKPAYCTLCSHRGHTLAVCFSNGNNLLLKPGKNPILATETIPKQNINPATETSSKQQTTPPDNLSIPANPSSSQQPPGQSKNTKTNEQPKQYRPKNLTSVEKGETAGVEPSSKLTQNEVQNITAIPNLINQPGENAWQQVNPRFHHKKSDEVGGSILCSEPPEKKGRKESAANRSRNVFEIFSESRSPELSCLAATVEVMGKGDSTPTLPQKSCDEEQAKLQKSLEFSLDRGLADILDTYLGVSPYSSPVEPCDDETGLSLNVQLINDKFEDEEPMVCIIENQSPSGKFSPKNDPKADEPSCLTLSPKKLVPVSSTKAHLEPPNVPNTPNLQSPTSNIKPKTIDTSTQLLSPNPGPAKEVKPSEYSSTHNTPSKATSISLHQAQSDLLSSQNVPQLQSPIILTPSPPLGQEWPALEKKPQSNSQPVVLAIIPDPIHQPENPTQNNSENENQTQIQTLMESHSPTTSKAAHPPTSQPVLIEKLSAVGLGSSEAGNDTSHNKPPDPIQFPSMINQQADFSDELDLLELKDSMTVMRRSSFGSENSVTSPQRDDKGQGVITRKKAKGKAAATRSITTRSSVKTTSGSSLPFV